MPTVNVPAARPTHDLGLSHDGNVMGFNFENGNLSMIETPLSPQAVAFQWSQNTWVGGRGNSRSSDDQTAFHDSGGMWTLTPNTLHPAPQWNVGSGIYAENKYLPASRGVVWKPIFYTTRYIACSFTPTANYTADAFFAYVRAVGKPTSLAMVLRPDAAGLPGAGVLAFANLTTVEMNSDTLSQWRRLELNTPYALVSGTTYWLEFTTSTSDANNHWEIGGQSDVGGSLYSTTRASWNVFSDSWNVFYRAHDLFRTATKVSSFEMYTCPYICASYATTTRIYINGDLCKATAGTANTITTTPAITYAAANQFSGASLRIVRGTGKRTRPVTIASHTTGAGAVFTINGTFDITPDATSIFVIYDTPVWTEVTGHGITAVLKSNVAVANNTAYFAQFLTAIRRMYFDTATGAYVYAADGANTADFLYSYKGYIWRTLDGAVNCDASFAPAVAAGSNLTFGTAITCGTPNYPVTNISDHNDSIYIFKYDGIYQITAGVAILINFGMDKFPSPYNGRVAVSSGSSLYFSILEGFERYTNGTVDDIGPNRHEGLPVDRNGAAVSALVYGSWIFVAIDAGPLGRSSVLAWNGQGWHEIFRAFQDGHEITHICMTAPNRLWVFIEDDAHYIDMPSNITNPLTVGTYYQHEAYLTTSTIDINKISFEKIFREVLLQTTGLNASTYIYIDYQLDDMIGAEDWYTVGGKYNPAPADAAMVAFVPAIGERVLTSPFDNIYINKGDTKQIRLRFRLCTELGYFPAVLYDAQLNGAVADPPKYQWNVTINVTAGKMNDFKADDVVDWLKDAAQNMRLLLAHSSRATLDNRYVYVSQPTIIRTSENLQNKKWDGRISFTLREP